MDKIDISKPLTTLNLTQTRREQAYVERLLPKGTRALVIGVKGGGGTRSDLDEWIQFFEEPFRKRLKVTRLPEAENMRYIDSEPNQHILQPAIIELEN